MDHTFNNAPLNFSLSEFKKDLRTFLVERKIQKPELIIEAVEVDWPMILTLGSLTDTLFWQLEPRIDDLAPVVTWLENYHAIKQADREAELRVAQLEAAITALRVLIHASNNSLLMQEALKIVRKAGV